MTVMKTVVWTPPGVVYWRLQQLPHKREFQAAPGIPPTLGNEGMEPKVVYPLVKRPFAPLEHETVLRDALGLAYTGSNVTVTGPAGTAQAGRARAKIRATASVNLIV